MKVKDCMTANVVTVKGDTSIKEVGRLIFSLRIGATPVVKGKKVVGIITDEDILSRVFPTLTDVIRDFRGATDFEAMEENISDLMDQPAKNFMTKDVETTTPETPLLRAQSTMLVNNFNQLPVVDKKGNLVGIIAEADIFYHLLRHEMPKIERERFVRFTGRHYDAMINWKKRFLFELPSLFKIFRKNGVKKVLDVGVWTGEYALGMVKKAPKRLKLKVTGLDHNPAMIEMCRNKKEKLPAYLKKRIDFVLTDFTRLESKIKYTYDAAISMGSAITYLPVTPYRLFKGVYPLIKKRGILILQLLNFEKILQVKDRLLSFRIQNASPQRERQNIKEHLFLEFLDKKRGKLFRHVTIIFDGDGKNWFYGGKTTGRVRYITKNNLKKSLKKAGFSEITFSGAMGQFHADYGPLTFDEPFKPLESDWLLVQARK